MEREAGYCATEFCRALITPPPIPDALPGRYMLYTPEMNLLAETALMGAGNHVIFSDFSGSTANSSLSPMAPPQTLAPLAILIAAGLLLIRAATILITYREAPRFELIILGIRRVFSPVGREAVFNETEC